MIPNAPTDNLYKFVTFLGVALIAFSSWSLSEATKRRDVAVLEQAKRLQTQALQDASIQSKVADIQALQSQPTDNLQVKIAQTNQLQMELILLATRKMQDAMNDMQPELVVLQHEGDVEMYRYGVGFGIVMTIVGSLCWYVLHQRHQDALLRTQVTTAKLPSNSDRSSVKPARHPIWKRVPLRRRPE
ncbi:hypothetical protein ACFVTJ_25065 [Agrobacterium sp. NPDC058088]|uniref:hypothetical protein n=1 Tax=Agrobacterium sp. NPDC058088 TaxID=3346335 RepID=UPI0036DEC109